MNYLQADSREYFGLWCCFAERERERGSNMM